MNAPPAYPNTKRINSAMLHNCIGEHVRLVGRIESRNGMLATVIASDKGTVQVHMNESSQYGTKVMEIIGRVNQDHSVTEMTSANFGDHFDLDTYDAFVVKAQRFTSVF
ncbi:60S acidic ribosomal protein P1-alpha 3 [Mortierella sp. AD031]|nr:60S acidic ribosomal protein P1-alpha 3 [Mortierella sp. AD031]KAG0213554.1 60S acidic ribosomal protein P1-alpha 3 [Mortierella sp. NVP41]